MFQDRESVSACDPPFQKALHRARDDPVSTQPPLLFPFFFFVLIYACRGVPKATKASKMVKARAKVGLVPYQGLKLKEKLAH